MAWKGFRVFVLLGCASEFGFKRECRIDLDCDQVEGVGGSNFARVIFPDEWGFQSHTVANCVKSTMKKYIVFDEMLILGF